MQFKHRRNKTSKFIPNLHQILSDYDSGAVWRPDCSSFTLYDLSKLISQSLPKYFRHSNLTSFIRQLNLYGFKKIVGSQIPENTYFHEKFRKDEIIQLKPIRSFYNQQKFGKLKKPKNLHDKSTYTKSKESHRKNQNNDEPSSVRKCQNSEFDIQKNHVFEKLNQGSKKLQHQNSNLIGLMDEIPEFSNTVSFYGHDWRNKFYGLNYENNLFTVNSFYPESDVTSNYQSQFMNAGQMFPFYQPQYYFLYPSIQ